MSASRERKERANKPVAQPQKKEKKKVSEGLILAISVVLVLVAVFGTILGIRYYKSNRTVMTVGDKDLKVKEFNYFFNQTANNFGNYASYIGIDTTTPIDKQNVGAENISMMSMLGMDVECLESYKKEDGSYDITWAGYFAELAKESAAQTYALYQAAMDAGYKGSEEVTTAINNEMLNVSLYSQLNGTDADGFIEAQFGDGCNEENYKQYLTVYYTASEYASNYKYDQADIDTKYNAAPTDYDVVTYMLYSAPAKDFEEEETEDAEAAEDTETSESTETSENTETTDSTNTEEEKVSEEAIAKAKEAAEKMEAEFNMEDSAVELYADYIRSSVEGQITKDAAAWMFETAKAGDVKLFEDAESNTYYVVKVLSNDVNYESINALQIYIPKDEETEAEAEDHTGHDHAEGEGHEDSGETSETLTAAEKLEAVKSGLASDASEENFRELASKHNGGNTVDLEDASYAYINGLSRDALLWVMEERKAGDYEVFEAADGTYVLYFMGASETYRNLVVNSKLVSEWIEELTKNAVANSKFDMEAAMNGGVSLTFTQNQG